MTLLRQIERITDCYSPAHRVAVSGFLGSRPSREVFQLFDSNLGLGLLLAYCGTFRRNIREPWDEAHRRIHDSRRYILGWLGFPSSKSTVRIVSKVDVERISVERCLTLRDLLSNESTAGPLRHLPAICDGVIDLLSDHRLRSLVTYSMLEEVCYRDDDDVFSDSIVRVLRLAERHDVQVHSFSDCASIEEMEEKLWSMESEAMPEWHRHYNDIVIPDPPISVPRYLQPPHIHIEAIQSPRELFQEAVTQRNCVFRLLKGVTTGRISIYRVIKPERATLMLRKSEEGHWIISQLLAARNRAVRRNTLWTIGAYLSRRQERLMDAGKAESIFDE